MWGDLVLCAIAAALPVPLALAFVRCRARAVAARGERPAWRAVLAANLLLLACLASLAFLAGEAYYRFWYDTTDSFGLTRTTSRWFKRYDQPNAMGFRDDVDYARAAAPGKRRISFLGDSFTAGHGVKRVADRFVNLLRRRHPEWEVECLARNGLDTLGHLDLLRTLEREGHELQDVVLISCLNDIAELVPEWRATATRVFSRTRDPGFLVAHSYLANTVYFRLLALLEPDVRRYFACVRDAYEEPTWALHAERLREIAALCRAHAVRLHVVLFPFLHELGAGYAYRAAHQKLAALWAAEGVPFLDLLPLLDQHAKEGLVVNRWDAHPNERAHALAAQAIEGFLLRQPDPVAASPSR